MEVSRVPAEKSRLPFILAVVAALVGVVATGTSIALSKVEVGAAQASMQQHLDALALHLLLMRASGMPSRERIEEVASAQMGAFKAENPTFTKVTHSVNFTDRGVDIFATAQVPTSLMTRLGLIPSGISAHADARQTGY